MIIALKKHGRFLFNAAYLAAVSILMRCVAVSFNAYVSAKIGAESMGLFTLVMSVYGFAVTLATSGVNLASVRLTAESCARLQSGDASAHEYRRSARKIMSRCAIYSLIFSLPTGSLLYLLSPAIGSRLLGDVRTVMSLKVLSLALPAISLTSALSGYFSGVRKVYKNALSAVTEQGMKIIFTSTALALSVPHLTDSVEYACLAVVGGSAVSEGLSLIISVIMYMFDNKRPQGTSPGRGGALTEHFTVRSIAAVSLPVALGAYARQGLSSAEHLAIPWGMKKSGLGAAGALASYGVLHGMVFPLILFPSAVLVSAAGLLVPELAEYKALSAEKKIKFTVSEVYSLSLLFSLGCAAVFFAFAPELGMSVYGSAEAGERIMQCAPLIPVMYFDMAVDCMLKGLGEQVQSMRINIIDSASSLLLVLILVPIFGISGYIVSVYFCEILNCTLSLMRLKCVTGVFPNIRGTIIPSLFCAAVAVFFTSALPRICGRGIVCVPISIAMCAVIYLFLAVCFIPDAKKKLKFKV